MFEGVSFLSRAFKHPNPILEKNDYQFGIFSGKLIGDAMTSTYQTKDGKDGLLTKFIMKWHAKSEQVVKIWGYNDLSEIAGCLEKGEQVFCIGTVEHSVYTPKTGKNAGTEVEQVELIPNILIPQSAITFLVRLMNSKAINEILQKEYDDNTDAMESADDFTEECAEDDCPF